MTLSDIPPLMESRPAPHPETEIFKIALKVFRPMQFHSMVKTKYPVKIEQDWSALRGVLGWSAIWLYPRYLHSQYMYFGLNMYFLSNTLLNSLLEMPTLTHQVVYCLTYALVCKFWEHLNPPPTTPITCLLEPICHTNNHCYTGCNSETYAIRFSIHQLIFSPNFRIIDQYLVVVCAELHLFWTILQQYLG